MGGADFAYWRNGILAADAADWITVAAYGLAALLAIRAGAVARGGRGQRERNFWRASAVLMALLGVNEVFDFQTLLTVAGRSFAREWGLFEQRRLYQSLFIAALALSALLLALALLRTTRRMHVCVRVALGGLVFIGAFVLVRAASFHHVDTLLGMGPRSFNYGSLQEMAGIVLFAGAAWRYASVNRGRRR